MAVDLGMEFTIGPHDCIVVQTADHENAGPIALVSVREDGRLLGTWWLCCPWIEILSGRTPAPPQRETAELSSAGWCRRCGMGFPDTLAKVEHRCP